MSQKEKFLMYLWNSSCHFELKCIKLYKYAAMSQFFTLRADLRTTTSPGL